MSNMDNYFKDYISETYRKALEDNKRRQEKKDVFQMNKAMFIHTNTPMSNYNSARSALRSKRASDVNL